MVTTRSLQIIFLLLFSVAITIACFFTQNARISIILIAIFILYSMYVARFEPTHPAVWLLPFLFLYHFNVVFLDLLGLRTALFPNVVVQASWIAICASSWVFLLFCKPSVEHISFKRGGEFPISQFVIRSTFLLLLVLAIMYDIWFLRSEFTTKRQLVLEGGGLRYLGSAFKWLALVYTVWLVQSLFVGERFPARLFVLVGLFYLFSGLFLGERDLFFAFLMTSVLVIYAYYKPNKAYVYAIGVFALVLVPIFARLKNLFTREVVIADAISDIFVRLLSGEFLSAGRNLDIIIWSTQLGQELFHGKTLIWDLGRILVPSFVYPVQNSVAWFNQEFRWATYMAGGGYGFSLAAEGYMNFGYIGVLVWYLLSSGIVTHLHNRSTRTMIDFVIYVVSIPFFVYATRGDFSYLISPILKQILLPIVFMTVLDRVLKPSAKRRKTTNMAAGVLEVMSPVTGERKVYVSKSNE